jgi:prolyl-tRNA editing enzyme YbaK/EbsC (Cys-tRNA(Pro) deacylase)
MLGNLAWEPARTRSDLLAPPVVAALDRWERDGEPDEVLVAEIDPGLADTAAFCARYEVPLEASANCVVISAKRAGETRLAACVVLATTRADVNNLVRKHLGARKASFAAMDVAVAETGMEYGGITPVGLPDGWELLIDRRVAEAGPVVVGSGVRRSKLCLPGEAVARLPGAEVLDDLGLVVDPPL